MKKSISAEVLSLLEKNVVTLQSGSPGSDFYVKRSVCVHTLQPRTHLSPRLRKCNVTTDCGENSVYDCMYVSLALAPKADLVTADERLANAVAAYLPVKWLGSLA